MRTATALVLTLMLAAGAALAANELIVTEIMYNSSESTDVEWFELYNNSDVILDLTGWYVLDDNLTHTRVPLSGTMVPGAVMVVAGTEALFTAKYPGVTNYFPACFQTYGVEWSLGNSGDQINVFDASEQLVCSVLFDDGAPWPTSPDGSGPSLVLVDAACPDYSDGTCWAAGANDGTPGVLTQTVSEEASTWGGVKSLFR
ncbi:MAG: lamin tail domain-containing protein [bacterium]|nr:lamin tail domain-containing protein [bacterium]